MKKVFSTFILKMGFSVFGYSQFQSPKIADLTTVTVVRNWNQYGFNHDINEIGSGFILSGKYLVTCSHIYKHDNNDKINFISVHYLFKDKFGNIKADTVLADLKPIKDGAFYINKALGPKKDVVVLKLIKNIPKTCKFPVLNKLTVGDILFCVQSFKENGKLKRKVQPVDFVGYFIQNNYKQILISGLLGAGLSGAPLINKNGEIVGMVQGGFPTKFPYELLKSSPIVISKVQNSYSQGLVIGTAAPIDFLLKNYIKFY